MSFVDSRSRKAPGRGRTNQAFRPDGDVLEDKLLLAIDLGGTLPSLSPGIATAPFGIDFPGATAGQGAGFSVADVGDLNGTGYDDFVIGAPTVGSPPSSIGSGINAAVYLVFGSQTVGVSTATDWIGKNSANVFNYTPNDRVGDLGQITNTNPAVQVNPITGDDLDFPFPGIKFVNLTNLQSMAGASVTGITLSGGQRAILIGAPGALDGNQANPGTGRAWLIWGSFNNFIGQTINLDGAAPTGLNIVTFVNTAFAGGGMGFSVAAGSNILGDGASDVILGAPTGTVAPSTTTTPVPTNTGVVYIMSTALLTGGTQTVNVSSLGQSGTQSLVLSGVNSGDKAGFSVADAGDVNGATSGGANVDDLLIGAPDAASSTGAAYLIYGGSNLANLATTTNGVRYINLANVGQTGTNAVPGAIITGPAGGTGTGFAVSGAGDFNGDGFGDFLVGTPFFGPSSSTLNEGAATMFYGAASTSTAAITGTISLANIPAAIQSVSFTGGAAGDMAGYALSLVGFINPGQPNLILIGAPGFNANNGTAYLIPGRAGFTGSFSLANAAAAPIDAVQFVLTTPNSSTSSPNFFGASVSSRFQDTTFTADGDSFADFVIGAPGYDVTQDTTRANAGGALVVEGGLITVPIPTVNTVTTNIGVGTPFAPFSINATTPTNLPIYVFGSTSTTPNFLPVQDINPASVTVDGIAFPTATLQQDPDTANYIPVGSNGVPIPDAIITISPRSALGLTSGVHVITVTGTTLPTSTLPNFTWTGTATVTVTGGSVTPVVTPLAAVARGPSILTDFVPVYGPNQFTPSLTALSALNYQPIPESVALAQFLPPPGFRQRIYSFNHPGKTLRGAPGPTNRGQNKGRALGVFTLSSTVFNRSRFHAQKTYTWTHKPPKLGVLNRVIPTQTRVQTFDDNLLH
jgi:hypothetical protein